MTFASESQNSMASGISAAAIEQDRQAPHGRCGDNPRANGGCGMALNRDEADNGVCSSYPDCYLS